MGILIFVIAFAAFISGYFISHITRPSLGETKKEALPPVNIEIPVEGDFDFVELEPMAPAPSFVKTSEIPIFMGVSEKSRLEQQLRSALFNGCLWEAVETFKTLKELGANPALLEFITVLQEFPAWDCAKISPEKAIKAYRPFGPKYKIKEEAARLFLRMAVFSYRCRRFRRRGKSLLITAAYIQAAYNALHTEIEANNYVRLTDDIMYPFVKGDLEHVLYRSWYDNYM